MHWPPKAGETLLASRVTIVTALAIACWPVARWYIVRLRDGSDEPMGLVALVAALVCAPRHSWLEQLPRVQLHAVWGLLGAYVLTFAIAPPLVRALLFVTMLVVAAAGRRFPLAWWMLLVLSLPVVATLQFYLGYPLRVATAILCVPLLRLGGLHVTSDGTTLRWAGETVIVDAPCSGIQMLWTGLLLASILSCWQQLSTRDAWRLLRIAGVVVFAANVLRATALFCTETRLWPAPAWSHEGIGLAMFGLAALAICCLSEKFAGRSAARPRGLDSTQINARANRKPAA